MTFRFRPFWQILADSSEAATLTCDECFIILEYLADEAAEGADLPTLHRAVQSHLARCPDCRAHHLQRLSKLEAELAARKNVPAAPG
jgi:predicted anti-sigma-YlaC factor YlaD